MTNIIPFQGWSGSSEVRDLASISYSETLLAEANHRIANNLALLASTIGMRAASFAKKEAVPGQGAAAAIQEITARIVTLGHLHRLLSCRPGAADADFGPHLRELCKLFVSALTTPGQVRLIERVAPGCMVSAPDCVPLSLIITEVITNSLKYAHPAGAPGILTIGCRRDRTGAIIVEVEDDGVGLPQDFDLANDGGTGSRTIKALARQIGAETKFERQPIGLRFELRLPAPEGL